MLSNCNRLINIKSLCSLPQVDVYTNSINNTIQHICIESKYLWRNKSQTKKTRLLEYYFPQDRDIAPFARSISQCFSTC